MNHKYHMYSFILTLLISLTTFSVSAKSIQLDITDVKVAKAPFELWKLDGLKKASDPVQKLKLAEAYYQLGQFRSCTKTLDSVWNRFVKDMKTWLIRKRLLCEYELSKRKINNRISLSKNLSQLISQWGSSPGHIQQALKMPIYEAAKFSLEKASESAEISFVLRHFQEEQKNYQPQSVTEIFTLAGQLSEKEERPKEALLNYLLAYKYDNKSELLRKKISLLDSTVLADQGRPDKKKVPVVSQSERKAYNDFKKQDRLGNYVLGIQKAVTYLNNYPEGEWSSRVSKRVSRLYLKMSAGRSDKLLLARQKAIGEMQKAPVNYLYDWSTTMFFRERYDDIIRLLESVVAKDKPSPAKILIKIALAHLHTGQFQKALVYFERVAKGSSSSHNADEALFRSGLLHYRLKNDQQAQLAFSAYLSRTNNGDYEVSSLYWKWRSEKRSQNFSAAKKTFDELRRRYPLSYFGLRASVEELPNEKLLVSHPKQNVTRIDLAYSKTSWETLKMLIEASWLKEAEVEIDQLKEEATSPRAEVFISKLYSRIFNHVKASRSMWPGLRKNTKLNVKENLATIFPLHFSERIKAETKRYKMDPFLIKGLIRQESSFHHDARSFANARGLMQILYTTAKEIARDLRLKKFKSSRDLYNPDMNIKIGTTYIYRLNRAFKGNLSLALAAYNAGIGNVRAWLKNRQDLNPEDLNQLDPDSEIWMDELPWSETSGYVKNVLRNWVVYNLIENPETKVVFPVK